ncbi:MAG TPA: ABC transporter permease [Candidatus Polarisedimenticolaceae bacterium]|nr:ABC transporter permease [Candidatus Polarisedimenticolaceae bacterium]
MTSFLFDLRFAARSLARNPGFAGIAILTLGLGIGANTAIFSVVEAVLLRPLSYADPERIVRVYTEFPTMSLPRFWVSPPEYRELQRDARSFEALGAWAEAGTNLGGDDGPLRVFSVYATHELFDVLGVPPALGRVFGPEEDVRDGPLAVILSDGLWRRAYGARSDIVGAEVLADGIPATVAGVMPPGFEFPPGSATPAEAWLPLQLPPEPENRSNHSLHVIGRLAPNVTIEQARDEADRLIDAWVGGAGDAPQLYNPSHGHRLNENHPLLLHRYHDEVVRAVRPAVLMLMGAVGFVLLIACVNVGNLLLARAEVRQREIAMRAALGAGTARLLAQFLAEGVLLAAAGGGVGILLANWGLAGLLAADPSGLPRAAEVTIDGRVLLFTLGVSLLAAVLFALAPLTHVRGMRLASRLHEGGHRVAGTLSGQRLRRALVVAQVALTVVLVTGTGLMVRAFWKLQDVDPGFRPSGVLTAQVELVGPAFETAEARHAFWVSLQERLAGVPGVARVTIASGLYPERPLNANDTDFEGYDPTSDEDPHENVDFYQNVGRDFFDTAGIAIVEGRDFEEADRAPGAAPVVIANQALARRFFPGATALGQRVRVGGGENPWMTIVGIAADVRNYGMDTPARAELYFDLGQALQYGFQPSLLNLLVRTDGDPRPLAPSIRAAVREIDPQVPLFRVRTMDEVVAAAMSRPRFLALLLTVFSALAIALAAVGIYGVVSYQVAQRRQEIGVRVALGADRPVILRMVMVAGLRLVVLGIVLGVGGAIALTRVMQGLLYGVSPLDAPSFLGATVLLLAVAAAACWLPALAATRVDPMVALRTE